MNKVIARLIARHIVERNEAKNEGRVVYVLARDGMFLRAGEIFIAPIAYKYVLDQAALTGDGSTTLAIHWMDESPLRHVNTYPFVAVRDIVMHSLSRNVIIDRIRRLHARRKQLAALN